MKYSYHRFDDALKTITYCSDTKYLDDPEVYLLAYDSVSSHRRDKVDRLVFLKDKKLSLGVELLLRLALEDVGEDYTGIDFVKNGKPVLKDSHICFNLSHSEDKVMCSISDSDVGCDVERIQPIDLDIARRYFFGSEYETIASADDENRYEMFYRFWTLKESFMKATGLGFELPLDSFKISLGDPVEVEQTVDDREYYFREFDLEDGYRYACCSLNDEIEPIRFVRLDRIFR